jgi:phage terminase large subunit
VSDRELDLVEARVGALLASHGESRSIRDWPTRYGSAPVATFGADIFGVHLWRAQAAFCDAVLTHGLSAWVAANAVGKSDTLALLAYYGALVRGAKVLLLSASARQTVDVFMKGAMLRLFNAGNLPGDLTTESYTLPDGRRPILAFTTSDVSKLGGFHSGTVWCLVDEAQGLENWIFEALHGNAVGPHDRVVLGGNALTSEGTFYRAFRTGTPWFTQRTRALEHPNFHQGEPDAEPFIPGGPTPQWLERTAAEYGPGTPWYLARVEAIFPSEAADALVPRTWCEAAMARHATAPAPGGSVEAVLSVDPSAGGNEVGVVVRQGDVIREVTGFRESNAVAAMQRIATIGARWGVTPEWYANGNRNRGVQARGVVVIDVCGLGSSWADVLERSGFRVARFNGAAAATTSEPGLEFANARSAGYWAVRKRLEAGRLTWPPGPEGDKLTDDLTTTEYRPTPTGKLAMVPKEEIAKRLGRSPDRGDALSMSLVGDEAEAMLRLMRAVNDGTRSYW